MAEVAKLELDGKSYELPVIEGSEKEKAIDIRKLRAETGYITFDSGFGSTGSCQSSVTFLDGEKGILRHRGYRIEDLCEKCTFEEVSYLLIYDKLPSAAELKTFTDKIKAESKIDADQFKAFFSSFPKDAHPMTLLNASVSLLSAHNPDSLNPLDEDQVNLSIIRLIAKLPIVAAAAYKYSIGEDFVDSDDSLSYSANFLHLMFSTKDKKYEILPAVEDVMAKLFILHGDHEQNCSASSVRLVGSSQANLFASVAAGIGALSGPLHGGANQKVLEQLLEISNEGGSADKFIAKAKDKNDPFRLMGFGHRVYKNFDPRAKIIKKNCDEVFDALKINDPLLAIAKELAETAMNDEYFATRKLYPNVDFYSGIIYKAIGFPVEIFTVLFAIGRLPGWISQWKEMHAVDARIGRPRQVFVGQNERPLEK